MLKNAVDFGIVLIINHLTSVLEVVISYKNWYDNEVNVLFNSCIYIIQVEKYVLMYVKRHEVDY